MRSCLLLFALTLCLSPAPELSGPPLLEEFKWREIGPCNMGGRITDIAVVEGKPQQYYVAAATGGVWKTVNNGTTWTPVFDHYGTASIGDVAVCASNPDLVWVGTGEANARNSVTHGDGIYKSVDGGKNFQNMGLRESRHIGRVVIHPKNADTVFVAAVGSVYVPTRERGLYKTTDGGKTWRCVKFVDEKTGFIDVALDPEDPNIVYAAAFEVRRDGFSGSGTPSKYGPGAGLYKSTDGGESWKKLAAGLPTAGTGRIGIDIYRKDPKVVYAIVETGQTPDIMGGGGRTGGPFMGLNADDAEGGITLTAVTEGGPAAKAGLEVGDVIKEFGGKKVATYQELVDAIRAKKPGDKVQVKFVRGGEEKTLEVTIGQRPEEAYPKEISFQDPVNRGGVFRSEDRGETWTHLSTTNPRAFYYSQIRIDPNNDQQIWVLGTQLHVSTNGGKNFSGNGAPGIHVDHHAMWIDPNDGDHILLGNDGGLHVTYDRGRTWEHLNNLPIGQFYAVGVDMKKPYRIYGGLQDNGSWGGPSRTRDGAIANDHWNSINGGDGFFCRIDPTDTDTIYTESQHGAVVRYNRKTGARKNIRPRGGTRFEWNSPIELGPRDPKRVYVGSSKLHESPDRGDTWKDLSGELTKTKQGSITAIGLSPVDENVLWVGSNDGGVWLTKDRGANWTEMKVPGLPELLWVTRLEPSRTSAGTVYLTVEGRRKNDLRPYVFRTTDFGKTWKSLTAGLPADEPVYVVRQDPKNAELFYLGTERTVYVSTSGGSRWVKLGAGLPVVPVHDLAVHPRDGELVAGTHGRSLWVVDIRPLQELSPALLLSRAHLFDPGEVTLWNPGRSGWFGGAKTFRGQNPPSGALISYYLGREAKEVGLAVTDKDGKAVGSPRVVKTAGLHRTSWNLTSGRGRVPAGDYAVTLTVDGEKLTRTVRVVTDPDDVPSSREK